MTVFDGDAQKVHLGVLLLNYLFSKKGAPEFWSHLTLGCVMSVRVSPLPVIWGKIRSVVTLVPGPNSAATWWHLMGRQRLWDQVGSSMLFGLLQISNPTILQIFFLTIPYLTNKVSLCHFNMNECFSFEHIPTPFYLFFIFFIDIYIDKPFLSWKIFWESNGLVYLIKSM